MRFEGKLKKAHEANKTTCIFFNLVCALIVPLVGYVRIKLALKQQLVYRQPGVRMLIVKQFLGLCKQKLIIDNGKLILFNTTIMK